MLIIYSCQNANILLIFGPLFNAILLFFQISFVLLYLVALVMRILKWAHIRYNSKRLSFHDTCREGGFRVKSAFIQGKWLFLVLKIAEKDENVKTGNCLKANFDIRDRFQGDTKSLCGDFENFHFLDFFRRSKVKILPFWGFLANFQIFDGRYGPKNQNFQNRRIYFLYQPIICP